MKLESELDGQLNAARASAADEGVADADVASGGDRKGVARRRPRLRRSRPLYAWEPA